MILLFPSIAVFVLIIIFMPKKLTLMEYYSSTLGSMIIQIITDFYLAKHFHLYHYFSPSTYWLTLLVFFLIYPSINIIFLNFFQQMCSTSHKNFYILFFVIFSIFYEWMATKTNFFYYTGWKLCYSAIIYPFLYIILLLNLKLVRKIISISK